MKKSITVFFIAITILIIVVAIVAIYKISTIVLPKNYYTAEDFGIQTIYSKTDYNGNGIDDYTDIMLGARIDAQNKPTYKSAYYAGGYPPDNEGVCTDVIWRAFKNAGYSLKDMVDEDIKENTDQYPRVNGTPDPNIDFRRVPNLKVFFDRNAKSLTLDLSKIEEWQPGDIVTFGTSHIGIISDKRNEDGIPYLIHNAGQKNREDNTLSICNKIDPISGHYRFER